MKVVICAVCMYIFNVLLVFGQLNPPVFIGQNTPAVPSQFPNQWPDPNFQIPSIPNAPGNGNPAWQSNGNQFGQPPNSINQFGPQSPNMNNMALSMNNMNQFGRPNGIQFRPNRRPFSRIGNQFGTNGPMRQPMVSQQRQPWAPGEPRWTFPSNRPMRESCQRRGCPMQGTQCIFMGTLCPSSVRRAPCRCERGCRVDTHFIPFGQSKMMDQCNNVCRCTSREGIAQCTTRRC